MQNRLDSSSSMVNGHSKLDIVHNFRHLQIVWPMGSLFRHIGPGVEGALTNRLE